MENGYQMHHGSGEVEFGSPPRRHRVLLDNSHLSDDQGEVEGIHSISTHVDYPASQPFIYDDYRRDPNKTTKAQPESNRQAVMSALRSLQEKIRHLELERSRAQDNLKSLASDTSRCKDFLSQSQQEDFPSKTPAIPTPQASPPRRERDVVTFKDDLRPRSANTTLVEDLTQYADTTTGTDVHGKLDSAEQRCQLLERQLECMRRLVTSAEHDRSEALRRSTLIQQQQEDTEASDLQTQRDKIADLEREHLKLTATQTMAESKIRELEDKLREERHYRKLMQEKAAELETSAEANRILLQATGTSEVPLTTKKVKKKKKRGTNRPNSAGMIVMGNSKKRPLSSRKQAGMEPTEHYKLNLADIPFISGKSTGPSHSLPANFQEVLSIMKNHNTKLCTSPRSHSRNYYRYISPAKGEKSGAQHMNLTDRSELSHLLMQLQEEFGQLTGEHEELSRQIQDCNDLRLRDDLERELDAIVTKMEAKGDQIARLRRHQETLSSKKKKLKLTGGTASSGYSTSHSMPGADSNSDSGEVQVTTTIRTKGKTAGPIIVKPNAYSKAQASLNVYKDLKKIQTTLRKDDITWD